MTGATYYVVKLAVAHDLAAVAPGVQLVPGMPVEAHVTAAERTALSYLFKPLTDSFSRAMTEE